MRIYLLILLSIWIAGIETVWADPPEWDTVTVTINPKGCLWFAGQGNANVKIVRNTKEFFDSLPDCQADSVNIPPWAHFFSVQSIGTFSSDGAFDKTYLMGSNRAQYFIDTTRYDIGPERDYKNNYSDYGIAIMASAPNGALAGVFLSDQSPPLNSSIDTVNAFCEWQTDTRALHHPFYIGQANEFIPVNPQATRLFFGPLDIEYNNNNHGLKQPLRDTMKVTILFSADTSTVSLFPRVKSVESGQREICYDDSTILNIDLNSLSMIKPNFTIEVHSQLIPEWILTDRINQVLNYQFSLKLTIKPDSTKRYSRIDTANFRLIHPQKTYYKIIFDPTSPRNCDSQLVYCTLRDSINTQYTTYDTLAFEIPITVKAQELGGDLLADTIDFTPDETLYLPPWAADTPLDTTLTITNQGECYHLRIDSLTLRNPQDSLTPPPDSVLQPDEETQFKVRMNLTPDSTQTLFLDTLTLAWNDPTRSPRQTILKANAGYWNIEMIPPDSLVIDSCLNLPSILSELTVKNSGNTNYLTIYRIRAAVDSNDSSRFSITIPWDTLTDGSLRPWSIHAGFSLKRPFSASLKLPGLYRTEFSIISNDRETDSLIYPVIFHIRGSEPEILIESPSPESHTLDFDSLKTGEERTDSVRLTNQGCWPLIIDSIRRKGPHSDEFIIGTMLNYYISLKAPILELDTFSVPIVFTPLSQGVRSDSVIIYYDSFTYVDYDTLTFAGGHRATADTIVLTGYGIAPELTVNNAELRLNGECIHSPSLDTLWLHNTGDASLFIDTVIFSDPVLSGNWTNSDYQDSLIIYKTIPPQDSLALYVEFTPDTTGFFNSSGQSNLRIHTNIYPADSAWREYALHSDSIRGQEIALRSLEGDEPFSRIEFPPPGVGNRADTVFAIANTGCAQLTIAEINIQPWFHHERGDLPLTLAPNDTVLIPVYFQPHDTLTQTRALHIISNDPNFRDTTIILGGHAGYPVPTFSAVSINFDSICVEADSAITLGLLNDGEIALIIESITVTPPPNDSFSLNITLPDDSTIAPGDSATIDFTFTATQVADFQGEINFTYANLLTTTEKIAPSTLDFKAAVSGQSLAIPRVIEKTVDFAIRKLGQSIDTSLTLSNPGCYPLTILELSIIGADAVHFTFPQPPQLPFSIAALDSLQLPPIRFTPPDTLLKTAQMIIKSDDPIHPDTTLSLRALRQYPLLEINSSFDYTSDSLCIHDQHDYTLRFKNTGYQPLTINSAIFNPSVFYHYDAPSTPFPPSPTQHYEMDFTFNLSSNSIGDWNDTLIIYSNSFYSPDTVALHLRSYGQQLYLPTDRYDMQYHIQYSQNPGNIDTVRICNSGCYQLLITGLALLDNANFHYVTAPALPLTINANNCHELPIAFYPDSAGDTAGILLINSDDPAHLRDTVVLTGIITEEEYEKNLVYPLVCTPKTLDGKNDFIDFLFYDKNHPQAEVLIFDKMGRKVATIRQAPYRWNGKDEHNDWVPPGVYLFYIKDQHTIFKKGSVLVVY